MEKFRKQKSIDSFCQKKNKKEFFDYNLVKFIQKHNKISTLFLKQGRTEKFKTETLALHFLKQDKKPNFKSLDGFLTFEKRMPIKFALNNQKIILSRIRENYGDFKEYFQESLKNLFQKKTTVKLWNISIVGSLVFGMFLMTFIYRYLGPNAAAKSGKNNPDKVVQEVLGEEDEKLKEEYDRNYEGYVAEIMQEYQKDSENEKKLKNDITKMVKGYPIEKMAPFIAKQDRVVAAFLVAIAKKESDWGKHFPVLDGEDCYNYWGYKGQRKRMGTGGHTCFDSPKDAVETVSKRLKKIIYEEKIDTPKDMVVVWKCGYDCSWDKPAAVKKWVQDVDYYFEKFDKFSK